MVRQIRSKAETDSGDEDGKSLPKVKPKVDVIKKPLRVARSYDDDDNGDNEVPIINSGGNKTFKKIRQAPDISVSITVDIEPSPPIYNSGSYNVYSLNELRQNQKFVALVDRMFQASMFSADSIPEEFFAGTIIDGELI